MALKGEKALERKVKKTQLTTEGVQGYLYEFCLRIARIVAKKSGVLVVGKGQISFTWAHNHGLPGRCALIRAPIRTIKA